MIGYIDVSVRASGFEAYWAAGVKVLSEDAELGGALPDPLNEGSQDWLWYGNGAILAILPTDLENGRSHDRLRFDVRSRRKYDPKDETLTLVFENSASSGIALDVSFGIRYLIKF